MNPTNMLRKTDSHTQIPVEIIEIDSESDLDDDKPSEIGNYVISFENDGNREIVNDTTAWIEVIWRVYMCLLI